MNFSDSFALETAARLYVQTHAPHGVVVTPRVLKNPLNGSGGTSVGARMAVNARRNGDRQVGALLARRLQGADPSHRWVVVLQRVSPKAFDTDNLAAALKSIRDGMADEWGVDDGADGPVWLYDWRKGEPKQHTVEVGLWVWREERADCGGDLDTCAVRRSWREEQSARGPLDVLSRKRELASREPDVIGSCRVTPNVVKPGGGR